jgi:myo-inositol-1(or 4)-monophosphatase
MVLPLPDAEPGLADDLTLLENVAREAGKLSLVWLEKGARVWDKSPGNPVTEADIAVNDLIAQQLGQARPDYGWLSEETRDKLSNRSSPRVFVVDPIDGTKAFVKGEPGFCVSIALLQDSVPVAGALYNPLTDEMFTAAKGQGAQINGAPTFVNAGSVMGGCRMVGRPEVFRTLRTQWHGMELIDPMPNAIAWRLALVASGRWDAAVALNQKNDWDLAAAVVIVEEAGGVITDRDGLPFVFNRPSVIQAGVVAAGGNLHPLLLEKIKELSRPA